MVDFMDFVIRWKIYIYKFIKVKFINRFDLNIVKMLNNEEERFCVWSPGT